MNLKGLAKEIKIGRARKGINQVELAERSGVSLCAIALIESENKRVQSVRTGTLVKIAKALDLENDVLLKYMED